MSNIEKTMGYASEILHNLRSLPTRILLDEMKRWANSHLDSVIRSKGYKNKYSKKARQFLKDRVFVYKRGDHFIGYHVSGLRTGMKQSYVINYITMHKVKTLSGNIYTLGHDLDKLDCYTAHYFDRYAERMQITSGKHAAIKNRDAVIIDWIHNNACEFRDRVEIEEYMGRQVVYDYSPHGIGLGEIDSATNLILIKTFVPNDMLKSMQVKINDKIREHLSPNQMAELILKHN